MLVDTPLIWRPIGDSNFPNFSVHSQSPISVLAVCPLTDTSALRQSKNEGKEKAIHRLDST